MKRASSRSGRWPGLTGLVAAASLAVVLGCSSGPPSPAPPTPTPTPAPTATPTAADSGPTDAVTAAFNAAVGGELPAQLDFLACVAGGADAIQFSSLFGALAQLALAESGIEPTAYWAAFPTVFTDFSAVEASRTGDRAMVHVSVKVTITPDVAVLRELIRRSQEARGIKPDDVAIDEVVNGLAGQARLERAVEHDVEVDRVNGAWVACTS